MWKSFKLIINSYANFIQYLSRKKKKQVAVVEKNWSVSMAPLQ